MLEKRFLCESFIKFGLDWRKVSTKWHASFISTHSHKFYLFTYLFWLCVTLRWPEISVKADMILNGQLADTSSAR